LYDCEGKRKQVAGEPGGIRVAVMILLICWPYGRRFITNKKGWTKATDRSQKPCLPTGRHDSGFQGGGFQAEGMVPPTQEKA